MDGIVRLGKYIMLWGFRFSLCLDYFSFCVVLELSRKICIQISIPT
jgi:hypothetical protein